MNTEMLNHLFRLAAGIGMFLFAMYLLEEALKNLSGRNFKRFLQRMTKNNIGAVAGGAIVTGILQSSSMVSLMVLAFVGAGVFTMKNAMALILGANLGTTLDSWWVATLGFKVDIEIIAYPAVAAGGLLLILMGSKKSYKYISYFLLGFGLLFVGLSFMKTAMEAKVMEFNFAKYAQMPLIVFLFIGFIITLIVQSSSVTMALALSALHAGAISFPIAAVLVLGSETGTTIKIMLSAIDGNTIKKRVVLGNFIFNLCITIFAFIFIRPILFLITDLINISDPLIGLVTFSSLINLAIIFIFLPFLNPFAGFLERFFTDSNADVTAFISHADINEPITALELFKTETAYFIYNSITYNAAQFEIDEAIFRGPPEFKKLNEKRKPQSKTPAENYDFIKHQQGELQAFYLLLRTKLEGEQAVQLNQLISSVRSAMHAVKSINDIGSNISNLRRSSKDIKYDFFIHHRKETADLYQHLNLLMEEKNNECYDTLRKIYEDIQQNYSTALNNFYKDAQHANIEDIDLTIAINFNRELFTSNKALLMAVKDYLLDEKQAQEFNELTVYMT